MASEFVLHIAGEKGTEAIPSFLADKLGSHANCEEEDAASPVLVSVVGVSSRRRELISEAFGFVPTESVWFRLRSKERYSEGKTWVLRATMALLGLTNGDAVLLYGEDIVLLRKAGRLVLNEQFSAWDRSHLNQLIGEAYEIRPLPSPLL
jgi:hypothetical protein